MTELVVRDLCVRARDILLVDGASFSVSPGEFTVLLGPNGAGKTTLLRATLGLLAPTSGEAMLAGRSVHALAAAERARLISYLPQDRPMAWPLRVRDVVALGRFAHGGALGRLRDDDARAADQAIKACDLTAFADRSVDTLSGGERARVHCARAFAAEAPLLIADEPAAALDPHHQLQIMALLRRFAAEGRGVLAVLHDVDLAARHADRLIWMKEGRILADGPPHDTLTEARMAEAFGVEATVTASGQNRRVSLDAPLLS